jgi:hypothetical protein
VRQPKSINQEYRTSLPIGLQPASGGEDIEPADGSIDGIYIQTGQDSGRTYS